MARKLRPIAAAIGPMTRGGFRADDRSPWFSIASVVAGLTLAVRASSAQTAAPQPRSETALPGVTVTDTSKDYIPDVSTVGAKQPTALRDIPQTVNVINRPVLDAQAAT